MRPLVLFPLLLIACGDSSGRDSASASSPTGALSITGLTGLTGMASSETASSSMGATSGGGSTSDALTSAPMDPSTTGSLPKFDVPPSPDGGMPIPDTGCKKVDLLFVIDNSGSMQDEQLNLVKGFPDFVAEMQAKLVDTESYHVGVITSDSNVYNSPPCTIQGALVTRTGGANASNQVCAPYASGKSYMNELDPLGAKFACAGQVGTGGDGNERPMQAMQDAVQPAMNAPGACNDGFIRDDALLVVVVITDEEDDHEVQACLQPPQAGSPGDPATWFGGMVAAKGGIETNIVVLALIGPVQQPCPVLDKCNGGLTGAETAPRVDQFAHMFTYGSVGQICAASYKQFFSDALAVIDTACENFMPPG